MLKGKQVNIPSNTPTKLSDLLGDNGPFTIVKIRTVSSTVRIGGSDVTDNNGYIIPSLSNIDIIADCKDDLANNLYFINGECSILAY